MGHGIWAGAVTLAIAAGVGALLCGYLGRFHGAGDSLAVFRVPLAFAVLALAGVGLALGARVLPYLGALAGVVALSSVAVHWYVPAGLAEAAGTPLSVYQKNLWFLLPDPAEVVADILASEADIVTLQEVGERAAPVLAALRGRYPVQVVCPSSRVGAVAVLSRLPEREGARDCIAETGMVSTVLETSAGPVRVASVHLHWPWPYEQAAQVRALADRMKAWERPAVIGGDFNMVRWSHAMRALGRASGTSPVGPARITLRNKRLFLNSSIDHVLATGGQGSSTLRPRAGSDHNGILVQVGWP